MASFERYVPPESHLSIASGLKDMPTIADLTKSLDRFVQEAGSGLIWDEEIRPHFGKALRAAADQADESALKNLDHLLAISKKEVKKEVRRNPRRTRVFSMATRLGDHYGESARRNSREEIYSLRLVRNFAGLITTARLAICARQLSAGHVDVSVFQASLEDTVRTFSGRSLGASIQFNVPEAGTSPSEIVRRSLLNVLNRERTPREHHQAILAALYWTLHWLEPEEKEKEGIWRTDHQLELPISAYNARVLSVSVCEDFSRVG